MEFTYLIILINKGEIIAQGSHNELIKNSEFYRNYTMGKQVDLQGNHNL